MHRSQINSCIAHALTFMEHHHFLLPPFAHWTPDQWRSLAAISSEITARSLGWDITDFGSDNFESTGLLLFTIRNGSTLPNSGKCYAEKIMIVQPGQTTPLHFHWNKAEDIINRGGGDLLLRLYNADDHEGLADTEVKVYVDGLVRTVPAGGTLTVSQGESITLEPRCYHTFCGVGSTVLVGEVSSVNNDTNDNRFYEPAGRFPTIIEDETPIRLLVGDYAQLT